MPDTIPYHYAVGRRKTAVATVRLVPGSGLLAACVPGAFGAWMLMLREYGTLRLRGVMDYATGYAAGGYPLLPPISRGTARVAHLFRAP